MTGFRYIGRKRRTHEDRRFVAGRGTFAADVRRPGMAHLAVLSCPHPAATILSIDASRALSMSGVLAVITGEDIAAAVGSLRHGLELPGIGWYPLAVRQARHAGEWVAAVVAEDRYIAEDAVEHIEVAYRPLPFVVDPEDAVRGDSPPVHADHGSNVVFRRTFTWGPVADVFAEAPHGLSYRVRWNRSATVPIETFGVVAEWDPGRGILDVWASIQMPKYAEQLAGALRLPDNAVRAHFDIDVGGSYGVKRGIRQSILAAHAAMTVGRPVRFLEDRLENMSGGDAHGPDRIFDVSMAYDDWGHVRAMRMRALDDVGVYPGRAPLQLGKPVGAIVGPYGIGAVEYEAISVTTNKTSQVAVRGFGQAPTNYAIETGMDKVARALGLPRDEVRRRNYIRSFPHRIPSGTEYDSGDFPGVHDDVQALVDWPALLARRDALRAAGRPAGVGFAACLEPSGGNSAFEPLFNPANDTTTWMESAQVKVGLDGSVTVVMATSTSGQGHETLAATIAGEVLERDPDGIRVVHADSLAGLPTNSPVGSRMAIMLGGAVAEAARTVRTRMIAIAAHDMGVPETEVGYADGTFRCGGKERGWRDIVLIAHRRYHRLPGGEPGLQALHVLEVPTGGGLPTVDGRVQMYPCYAFEAHVALVSLDPVTGKPTVERYAVGHDCGTVINPDIVHGMIRGGVAHGIGAALYERFRFGADGQHLSGSLTDYLLPSAFEVPEIEICERHTPSPHTSHGQKGAGEAGYLGAPAAIASAVNDALEPFGGELLALPMTMRDIRAALDPEPEAVP